MGTTPTAEARAGRSLHRAACGSSFLSGFCSLTRWVSFSPSQRPRCGFSSAAAGSMGWACLWEPTFPCCGMEGATSAVGALRSLPCSARPLHLWPTPLLCLVTAHPGPCILMTSAGPRAPLARLFLKLSSPLAASSFSWHFPVTMSVTGGGEERLSLCLCFYCGKYT